MKPKAFRVHNVFLLLLTNLWQKKIVLFYKTESLLKDCCLIEQIFFQLMMELVLFFAAAGKTTFIIIQVRNCVSSLSCRREKEENFHSLFDNIVNIIHMTLVFNNFFIKCPLVSKRLVPRLVIKVWLVRLKLVCPFSSIDRALNGNGPWLIPVAVCNFLCDNLYKTFCPMVICFSWNNAG